MVVCPLFRSYFALFRYFARGLRAEYPAVYEQLAQYYRQDPAARLARE
jgi:Mlc titration factor MtfA (ptsG expression regulator)